MPLTPFAALVRELLEPLGPVTIRAMFGGYGIALDGVPFALIADDVLYLKVDSANRSAFEQAGCAPFRPFPDKPNYVMSYYEVPPETMDDSAVLCVWARDSLSAALRARAAKPASRKAKNPARLRHGPK